MEACELIGEPRAVDVLQLEDRRVPGFDHDRGERQFGEALHLERECSVGECAGEVLEGLPFDSRNDRSVRAVNCVVAGDDGRTDRLGCLASERVGVALAIESTVIVTGPARARLRGIRPPGFAALAVFCVCQKIASRPFTRVKTN